MNTQSISAAEIIARARAEGRQALDEATGKTLLSHFGVRTPRSVVVTSAEEGRQRAAGLIAPFVVKVVSAEILHKSDAGGVTLHLADGAAVADAINAMSQKPGIATAKVDGWLVEEMIPPGREVVIGGFRDPQFGPMIMVGLGGIFVEVLKDVSFRICPIDRTQAQEMLSELKGRALLQGARGEAAVNEGALLDAIVAIGGAKGLLMTLADDIAELPSRQMHGSFFRTQNSLRLPKTHAIRCLNSCHCSSRRPSLFWARRPRMSQSRTPSSGGSRILAIAARSIRSIHQPRKSKG